MREERSVYSVIDQQSKLIGTKSEIEKFEMLENLYNSTRDYFDWIDFFDKYSNLSCIKIAIENTGKSYDEDVEVILNFNDENLILPNEFPELLYSTKKYLVDEFDFDDIFGVKESINIKDYNASIMTKGFDRNSINLPTLFGVKDYDESLLEELLDTFDYSIYSKDSQRVIKLDFDYVKHNTVVAFPTVLFVKGAFSEIKYEIKSKHSPDKVTGSIGVRAEIK